MRFRCSAKTASVDPRWLWGTVAGGVGLILVLSLGAGPAFGQSSSQTDFRDLVIEQLTSGNRDSTLALVRADRGRVPLVVQDLLVDRIGDLLAERPEPAAERLRQAAGLAELFAEAFADSFCLRIVSFYENLSAGALPKVAAGWARFREVYKWYEASDLTQMKEALPDLLATVRSAEDPYLELRTRRLAARGELVGASPSSAREEYLAAAELAFRLGDYIGRLNDLINVSWTFISEDRYDEALRSLNEVLEPARIAGEWSLYVGTLRTVAVTHMMRGDPNAALEAATEGLTIQREKKFKQHETEFLEVQAHAYSMRGQYEEAMARAEEALQISREEGLKLRELSAIITLGELLLDQELLSRALALLREGLRMAQEIGHPEATAILSAQVGDVYRHLGRPDEALEYYREVLPAARKLGQPSEEALALRDIAVAQLEMGDVDQAVESFQQALAILQGTELRNHLAQAFLNLGRAQVLAGKLDLAEKSLQEAHALADSIGNPLFLGETERFLARVCVARGDDARALALCEQAITRGRLLGTTYLLRQALVDKAEFLLQAEDWTTADSLLAEAIEIVESIRESQAGEEVRLGFLTDKKSIYVQRVSTLFSMGEREGSDKLSHREAFHVAERAKARSLLDIISGTHVDPGEMVPPTLREKERRLAARLAALQMQLSSTVSADTWDWRCADSLETLHAIAARDYRATLEEIGAHNPTYGALYGQHAPLDLDEVRGQVLEPGQVLLEFLVGESETYLFLVGKDDFQMARIPEGTNGLKVRVNELRRAILSETESIDGGATGESADLVACQDLYALLIEPIAPVISPGTRLLVVPDGPLFYLPFGALHDGTQFLVERHAIAYAPSASVLDPALRRTQQRGSKRSLIAVGNPASFRARVLLANLRDVDRWRFGELPYSEDEVHRVAAYFDKPIILTGEAATEETVKALIGEARYLHFATHGLLNEEEPILSGLALAQDEDPEEDGLLQTHEILKLDLSADLVTLSACNTGLGPIAGGEGVLGLTRAFMYAGARSLLISLWEVGDQSTVRLMDAVYNAHIKHGLPTDIALQDAQVAAISAGDPVREWSAFVVAGFVGVGRDSHRDWLPILLMTTAVLGLLVWVVWKRRKKALR